MLPRWQWNISHGLSTLSSVAREAATWHDLLLLMMAAQVSRSTPSKRSPNMTVVLQRGRLATYSAGHKRLRSVERCWACLRKVHWAAASGCIIHSRPPAVLQWHEHAASVSAQHTCSCRLMCRKLAAAGNHITYVHHPHLTHGFPQFTRRASWHPCLTSCSAYHLHSQRCLAQTALCMNAKHLTAPCSLMSDKELKAMLHSLRPT